MKSFDEELKEYIENNKLTYDACAEKLGIDKEKLSKLGKEPLDLSEEEKQRILNIINGKVSTGKKINRILDLIFRLGACVMALVTLLLCIKGIADYKVLTALLSIGLVCTSITGLPKIEK